MLNLTDALFIGTLFRVLVLSIAGGDGLAIGGGMGIKDEHQKRHAHGGLPKTRLRQYPTLHLHR